jgi:hypothetical protein
MPFGPTQSKNSVTLEVFSGIITAAADHDIPEGGSSRNQDVDFEIGSVGTRPGLTSAFGFSTFSSGTPQTSVSASPAVDPWVNPGNILLNTGAYTTFTPAPASLSQKVTPAFAGDVASTGSPWTNPNNILSPSLYAVNTFSVDHFTDILQVSGNMPVIPSSATISGVMVQFAAQGSGINVTCSLNAGPYQVDTIVANGTYTLGSPTFLWGQTITPASVTSMVFSFQGNRFTGSSNLGIGAVQVSVYWTEPNVTGSDNLQVTKFEFDISTADIIASLNVSLTGLCADPANVITGQLLYNGSPLGSPQVLTLAGSSGIVSFGTNWGVALSVFLLNNPTFGIQITASAGQTVYLSYVNLRANTSSGAVDFNYLKTGQYDLGSENIQTLALDSAGNLYSDPNFSGTLSQLSVSGVPAGTYAKSVSQDSREYICFSNLQNGTYPPIQYVPNPNLTPNYWADRVTQVGPGASPSFSNVPQGATLAVVGQGSITAWSITGNVVTFTATNSFTAGEIVTISGLVAGAFMNGVSFNVLGTGLSTSQFEVNFVHANAAATETGVATPQYSDAITSITQLPIQTSTFNPVNNSGRFTGILWSAGPGSTAAGNTATIYYWDAQQNATGDTALINAFNSGVTVYVYVTGTTVGVNGCWQVTSVGIGKGPGGQDNQYFFTYQMPTSNYQKVGFSGACLGEYQQTVATITLALPNPSLAAGTQVTLSGVSGTGWNTEYTITSALNSGAYAITGTQMTAGVATYNYAAAAGTTVPPAVGQLVTITNTLNGNGIFNVADATITSVNTGAGTFTVAGFASQTIAFDSENGQATTAGTQFTIDPGAAVAGTNPAISPIHGNATGGALTVLGGTAQQIGAGTRQGACMFLTRNGAITAPSAPVTFTIPENSNYVYATSIPIGPPNTVGRIITLTEAGSNGVAGGSFYYIPNPVQFTVNGQVFLSSSFVINDNVTSSAAFTFTDQVLLAATEIDVQGNNLFNQIELGNPAWTVSYAGRLMFGGCQSKVQNFTNLSFDGGYLNASGTTNLLPLGWNVPSAYNPAVGSYFTITGYAISGGIVTFNAANTLLVGQQVYVQGLTVDTALNNLIYTVLSVSGTQFTAATTLGSVASTTDSGQAIPINEGVTLNDSAIFGNSLFISNTTGTVQSILGMLTQSAYQDAYQVPIVQPNTLYSVRITARATTTVGGALVIDLTSQTDAGATTATAAQFGQTYGQVVWAFSQMSSAFTTRTFTLLTTGFGNATNGVPTDLVLRLFAENIPNGASVEIDSIEIFPTQQPINSTNVYASYAGNPEGFDGVTGILGLDLNNPQPVNGAAVLYDLLYFLKSGSIFVTQDSEGSEPSQWDIKQVAARAGTIGPNSYDVGENYILTADRSGVYIFTGNQPQKINWEIQAIWDAINWSAGRSIWVRNDTTARRLYVGIPLPTPNYWLPDAPTNSAPTSPNVVMMCNYQAINTGSELAQEAALSETVFGNLKANDLRRKWSLWNIASPCAALLTQSDAVTQTLNFGNGIYSSQILKLDPTAATDAGTVIDSRYTTYGFVDTAKLQSNPLLGFHQKRFTYMQTLVTGTGVCDVTFYPNSTTVVAPNYTYSVPGGLNLNANVGGNQDFEKPLNVRGQRMFVEFSGADFSLSKLMLVGGKDVLPIRGNIM